MSKFDIQILQHELVYLKGLRLSHDPRLAEAAARREQKVRAELEEAGGNVNEIPEPAAA